MVENEAITSLIEHSDTPAARLSPSDGRCRDGECLDTVSVFATGS